MNWQIALQTFSACFAAIGCWFIYDLIREFKSFKTEAKRDIENLKSERKNFEITVRNSELIISQRVSDMQKIHMDSSFAVHDKLRGVKEELERAKVAANTLISQSERLEEYLNKSFQLSKSLHEHIKRQNKEIESIKIHIGKTTIFK